MTEPVHERVMRELGNIIGTHEWDRLGEVFHDDAVLEYPQSREVFRGVANIRGQFDNYPDLEAGASHLEEIIGGPTYAMTPSYTVVVVRGSGDQGTAVIRTRYPDGTWWWVLNIYEVRDGRISRSRTYFAPDFEAPDWRGPYREAP